MTVKEFLTKYDNNEQFKESDLRDIFNLDLEEEDDDELLLIEEEKGENRRWTYMEYHYIKVNNRYFLIQADIGLTEYQENEYWYQPEEMLLEVTTKIIQVTENNWISIKRKEIN